MRRPASFLSVLLLLLSSLACDDKSAGAKQSDGPEGLKAVFTSVASAAAAKDHKTGAAITKSLIPDKDSLKKAIRDDAPASFVDEVMKQYAQIPPDDEKVATLLVPGQGRTEIKAYGSTTEDLIAYKEGTPAFAEFPGGAKRLAEAVLRPGVTFYEVEVTEPGQDAGTKYHMFFWDGAQWRMLGPAWRALGQ